MVVSIYHYDDPGLYMGQFVYTDEDWFEEFQQRSGGGHPHFFSLACAASYFAETCQKIATKGSDQPADCRIHW